MYVCCSATRRFPRGAEALSKVLNGVPFSSFMRLYIWVGCRHVWVFSIMCKHYHEEKITYFLESFCCLQLRKHATTAIRHKKSFVPSVHLVSVNCMSQRTSSGLSASPHRRVCCYSCGFSYGGCDLCDPGVRSSGWWWSFTACRQVSTTAGPVCWTWCFLHTASARCVQIVCERTCVCARRRVCKYISIIRLYARPCVLVCRR